MFPGALSLRLSLTGSLLSCRRIVTLSSPRTPAATTAMSANSAPPRKLAITTPATAITSRATVASKLPSAALTPPTCYTSSERGADCAGTSGVANPRPPLAPTTLLHVITILGLACHGQGRNAKPYRSHSSMTSQTNC